MSGVAVTVGVARSHPPLGGIFGGFLYREVELMSGDERW